RLLLRRVVDLVVSLRLAAELLRQNRRHRRRQRRLPVVHVTNRPNVHVRLRTLKFALGHISVPDTRFPMIDNKPVLQNLVPMERIERSTSPLPRECSATELHGPAAEFSAYCCP